MRASRRLFGAASVKVLEKIILRITTILEEQKKIEQEELRTKAEKDDKLAALILHINANGLSVEELTNYIEKTQPTRKPKKA